MTDTGKTLQEKLRILKELQNSEGWAVIQKIMKDEIVTSALRMADGQPMPPEQYNFHRGAMWAGKQLLEMLPKLISNIENEIILQTKDPAKAGKLAQQVSLRPDITKGN